MKHTTTAFLGTTLLTALFASQLAIAGQAPTDEYSAAKVYSSEEEKERVNFSIDVNPIEEEVDTELFPEYEH